MKRSFAAVSGIVLIAAISAPAWGIANVTASGQSVYADAGGTIDSQAAVSAGPFNATANDDSGGADPLTTATASQNSNIQPLLFGGTGSADLVDDDDALNTATANSTFEVFFNLTTPHAYSLTGLLDTSVDGGNASSRFQWAGVGGFIVDVTAAGNSAPSPINRSGVLAPGGYHLEVHASTSDGDDEFFSTHTEWQFSLSLRDIGSPVPEPLTPALLAMAGGTLMLRRLRSRPRA